MFSAYDLECKEYFSTGKNSETRNECVKAIWEFMTEDWEDEQIENTKISDVLHCSSVEIKEHNKKIN